MDIDNVLGEISERTDVRARVVLLGIGYVKYAHGLLLVYCRLDAESQIRSTVTK